jgi:biotin operon repressor
MLDRKITEYLKGFHRGESRAVSSRELEAAFGISGRELRGTVNRLRVSGVPICSSEYGYFYAADEAELNRTVRPLTSRIKKIAEARSGLIKARALYSDDGQLRLPLEGGGDS